jgi:hypothetical protein
MTHVAPDVVWAVLIAGCVIAVILLYIAIRQGLRLVWLPRAVGREHYPPDEWWEQGDD